MNSEIANTADGIAGEAAQDTINEVPCFQINQEVVYPSQGVGKIVAIIDKEFKNNKVPYYVIYLEVSDMTIMTPVSKAGDLGIRSIVSPDEAMKALNFIGEDYEPIPSDWKIRYQMNLDLLKKGSIMDIASIVRSLYHRSKIKELPIMERKLYDSALKLLEDEISFSIQKTREEVEAMIFEKLEFIKADEEDVGDMLDMLDVLGDSDNLDVLDSDAPDDIDPVDDMS
jgi:CarD family transcriptional regulator